MSTLSKTAQQCWGTTKLALTQLMATFPPTPHPTNVFKCIMHVNVSMKSIYLTVFLFDCCTYALIWRRIKKIAFSSTAPEWNCDSFIPTNQIFGHVFLGHKVSRGPVGVDQVPVGVNEHGIPAVVVFVALEFVTGSVVKAFCKASQHHRVHTSKSDEKKRKNLS